MKRQRISIICILLIAISLVLTASFCFAEEEVSVLNISELVGKNIQIDNLADFLSKESLSKYDDKEIRVIVEYNENRASIVEDLKSLNIESKLNCTYNKLFYGQSINIKIKDILALTKLDYVKSVSLCDSYQTFYEYSSESNTINGVVDNSSVYKGENMLVCVIDDAFDISHPALNNIDSIELKLSLTDLQNSDLLYSLNAYDLSNVTAQELYVSDKIPFAYDYAEADSNVYDENLSHGTHVAGILAGNCADFKGVVPNAQMALMKIGDKDGYLYDDVIIMALEDCVKLKPDVINLSFGSNGGFAYQENSLLYKAINKVKEEGVSIVCAAGNSYTSAYGSEQGEYASYENMDNGTIAAPASFKATESVANAQETNYVEIGVKNLILNDAYYSESKEYGNYFKEFSNLLENPSVSRALTYKLLYKDSQLMLGKESDYDSPNQFEGKIAVVLRGEITFAEKLKNAKAHGAIGIIVVNNDQPMPTASIDVEKSIPFAMAPNYALEAFLANANNLEGQIVFPNKTINIINNSSSQGLLEDFSLGIDFAAFGTNIKSLDMNQSYIEMTGTSMASPNAAGVVTSVKQFVKENYNLFNIDPQNSAAVSDLALKIIMSNTTILKDENNIPLSPRVQGAGLANLDNALQSYSYIEIENSKTKIEIKEDVSTLDNINLKFNVVNKSTLAKEYNVSLIGLTEYINEENKMSGHAAFLDLEIISIKVNGTSSTNPISISGNDSVQIEVTFKLTNQAKEMLNKLPYGGFVEGYVKIESSESILTCPFVSYYGDWDSLEILDKKAYEVSEDNPAYIRASKSYGVYAGAYYLPLGEFAYILDEDVEAPDANEKYASLSIYSSAMYSLGYIQLGLLRNAEYISIEVVNKTTGEVVYTSSQEYVPRTLYYSQIASMYGGELIEDISPYSLGLHNNTEYITKVKVYRTYEENSENKSTYTQEFTVDFEAPVVRGITYSEDKNTASLEVYDNNYPQAVLICTGKGTSATSVSLYVEKIYPIVARDKMQTTKIDLDISSIKQKAMQTNGYIYYYVVDYAFNYSIYYDKSQINSGLITAPSGSNKPSGTTDLTQNILKFNKQNIEIEINEEKNLAESEYLKGYDLNKSATWSTSNKDVLALDNGKITGLSCGIAVVEVVQDNAKATIIVEVKNERYLQGREFENAEVVGYDIKESLDDDLVFGIDVTKTTIALAPGEAFSFKYKYIPYNYNYIQDVPTITITCLSGSSVYIENNTIKAVAEGESTINININSKDIKTYKIKVCSSVYIEENMLKAVFSNEEAIDLSAYNFVAVANNAFRYSKYVKNIILPDSAKVIYGGAFESVASLVNISMPNVTTIYENAFLGCSSLEEIDLTNIKQLKKNAFNGCKNLKIVIFAIDQLEKASISMDAFSNCERLQAFRINGIDYKTLVVNKKLLITLDYTDLLTHTEIEIIGTGSLNNIKTPQIDLSALNIKRIENSAFKDNTTITKVVLNNVEYIGDQAFSGCANLESVKISSTSLVIGNGAFENSGVKSVDFSGIETTFKDRAFLYCKNLQYVNMGIVQDIGKNTFAAAEKLTYVEFEEGSKKIGQNTFALTIINNQYYYLDELISVSVPASITQIDEYAFAYCRNLSFEKINLQNVERIEKGAFYGTKINETIILPNVTYIGYGAFAESNISKISINENANTEVVIDEIAFYKCANLETVKLPKGADASVVINKGAFYECTSLSSEAYEINFMTHYKSQYGINLDRVKYIGDYAFYGDIELVEVCLDEVGEIGYGAFAYCEKLNSISTPKIEIIDDFAFLGVNINRYIIPNTIKQIGQSVFNENENIVVSKENKEYPNIVFDYTSDGYAVIYSKLLEDKLMLVYYPKNSQDDTYTVLANTQMIGAYAFYGAANLNTIILNNVEYIGHGAMYKCSFLKCVKISGDLPVLISTYNSNSLNTYCNFIDEQDKVDGLILLCDDEYLQKYKESYLYNEYFDYILNLDQNVSTLSNLVNLVNYLKEIETKNMTKEDVEQINSLYSALTEQEKELFASIAEFKNEYNKYLSASSKKESIGEKVSALISDDSSLFNLPIILVIIIFALIGLGILSITVAISWYFSKRAMNKKSE